MSVGVSSNILLQFAPFSSAVDSGFWWKLSQRKLDVYKLDDTPTEIRGFYNNDSPPNISGYLNVDYTAFDESGQTRPFSIQSIGTLVNKNTIEDFKDCDKKILINVTASKIWKSIVSGTALEDVEELNRFLVLCYVDLKKYSFVYWFAFPALCYPEATTVSRLPTPFDRYFDEDQKTKFVVAYDKYAQVRNGSYFLLHIPSEADVLLVGSLGEFETLVKRPGKLLLGFRDPCTLEAHPGWPLRNFLALAAYHWKEKLSEFDVLCLRDRMKDGVRSMSHSVILHLKFTLTDDKPHEMPGCVGWELNERQKKGPRIVNLSSSMNPEKLLKLAETSVDLNLKLMRWRLVPTLDLDVIRNIRCLLLGSGTLGCNVARCLMGWGIRSITMVDNGRVSYSNPVRQSLFNFNDCLDGGKLKATAAAESLAQIFPNMDAKGVDISIPMPGHFVSDSEMAQVLEDVEHLENLILSSDVVFLLTDTRESRWLPSVIAARNDKLVINAALGFDTFLVMRHGVKGIGSGLSAATDDFLPETSRGSKRLSVPGNQLGCYFCNDVVAPGDSTRHRTMDQQCTVTRPGISMIAGALAVELMVSVFQHPNKGFAPADTNSSDEDLSSDATTPLGIVPHQIRGFLSLFYHILPVARCFNKCTACSDIVIEEYSKNKLEFLMNAFNRPSYLEDLSGLTQLHNDTREAEVWELSDDADEC